MSTSVLAHGTLAKNPLPELLVAIYERGLEGTLVLQRATGEKDAILFVRGAPAKAKLCHPSPYLGDVLVELGVIDDDLRTRTWSKAQSSHQRHGQVLVAERHCDESEIFVALREQLQQQVMSLADLPPDTMFGLYQANYLANWGAPSDWRVKPLPLLWRALIDKAPIERIAALTRRLGAHPLRMRVEAPVGRFHMEGSELAVVNMLRAQPQPIEQLAQCGVGSESLVHRVAYALAITKQLEVTAKQGEPVGLHEPPESPTSIPPPSSREHGVRVTQSPSIHLPRPPTAPTFPSTPSSKSSDPPSDPFRIEIARRMAREDASFYEILAVPETADTNAIRAAFFQLAKRWHPDKLASDFEDVRPQVTKIFARMSEAHQVLTDEARRKEYDQARTTGDEEQEKVTSILRAASSFQRAEIHLKRGDHTSAFEDARTAYEGDPEQAEYAALYAYLQARTITKGFTEQLQMLDRAIEREPNNIRILWYRGQVLKKAGLVTRAMRDFHRIVELKPNHLDAKRELRIHSMRMRTDPGATKARDSSRPSFLGGLFKKS